MEFGELTEDSGDTDEADDDIEEADDVDRLNW